MHFPFDFASNQNRLQRAVLNLLREQNTARCQQEVVSRSFLLSTEIISGF